MVLRKINIENFRAFKKLECEFADGINLVIGDNGAGKTSLLSAITHLMSVQVAGLGGSIGVETIDPHIEIKKAGDATISMKEGFPIKISGLIEMDNASAYQFGIIRNDYNNSRYEGDINVIKELVEQDNRIWPLINYQRFDRKWGIGRNAKRTVEVETGANERRDGYVQCLNGNGQDDRIQKWCLKMSILEYEQKGYIQEFEHFKYIIKRFLQTIEGTKEEFEVSYSMGVSGLVMKNGDLIQPLFELSTGYNTILSMIMELAYRSALLNPSVRRDDTEQSGIVIIDEIDAHLHPKWQWRVLEALKECFPKVQFIIATHSPIVIASSKGTKLINLQEKDKVSYSNSAYGYNVADVLDLKQGSTAIPKVSAVYMERLERALDNGKVNEAEKVILEAENEFGDESPIYYDLKNYLEVNRWVEGD